MLVVNLEGQSDQNEGMNYIANQGDPPRPMYYYHRIPQDQKGIIETPQEVSTEEGGVAHYNCWLKRPDIYDIYRGP